MSEEKIKNSKEAAAVVFPPQSSLKLVSHGNPSKPESFYYTWEIKRYCDNLDVAMVDVVDLDKKMKVKFGGK